MLKSLDTYLIAMQRILFLSSLYCYFNLCSFFNKMSFYTNILRNLVILPCYRNSWEVKTNSEFQLYISSYSSLSSYSHFNFNAIRSAFFFLRHRFSLNKGDLDMDPNQECEVFFSLKDIFLSFYPL